MKNIYSPEEDSFLLSKVLGKKIPIVLKKNPNAKFLEIGCGSGIQLKTALESGIKKENIFSCDINSMAVKHCKKIEFNCVKSNLFEKITGKYEIVVFNPPYLPEDSREPKNSRIATTGGKNGGELTSEFLKQAKKHMMKNGRIFLVASSLTKGLDFAGYKKKKVAEEKLFFEKLSVFELFPS
ncbi:MAG: HemK2/MTQ2 family protein methyltransferase [Nanoarchaeota archaeon]